VSKIDYFSYPAPIPAKIWGVSLFLQDPFWSSKVIDFCINRKRMCIFLLVVSSNLHPIFTVSEIRRLKCRKSTIFPTQLLFPLKFGAFLCFCRTPFGGANVRRNIINEHSQTCSWLHHHRDGDEREEKMYEQSIKQE